MFSHYAPDILQKARAIRLAVFDVDGVLTDGRLWFTPQGDELKAFHARDGHGIKLIQRAGIETAVISGRRSPAVALRLESLGVRHVYQGCEQKRVVFESLLGQLNLTSDQVCFIGDDVLDLPILRRAGLSVAVADAHFAILPWAHLVTRQAGGAGAVREICDLLLHAQDQLEKVLQSDD